MKKKLSSLLFIIGLNFSTLEADDIVSDLDHILYGDENTYDKNENLTFYGAVDRIKWELAAVTAGTLYTGISKWNWGSSNSFKISHEGWFGMDTGSAGSDKIGHMYSTFLISELFTKRLLTKTNDRKGAALYGASFSSAIMLLIEVWDGYSVDHGFSYEDLVLDLSGAAFSYFKNTVPNLDEKLDFRFEYRPNGINNDHPITNYSAHNYAIALKMGGFRKLQETPLKYFELQVGYHTEGFKENEKFYYDEKRAEVYFAVALDLTEVLFKPLKKYTSSPLIDYADTFFHYYQAPVYVSTPIHLRTEPFR